MRKINDAREYAEKAFDLEEKWGDSPTWGNFYRAIDELVDRLQV